MGRARAEENLAEMVVEVAKRDCCEVQLLTLLPFVPFLCG